MTFKLLKSDNLLQVQTDLFELFFLKEFLNNIDVIPIITSSTSKGTHSYVSGQMLSLGNVMFLFELVKCHHKANQL